MLYLISYLNINQIMTAVPNYGKFIRPEVYKIIA